MEYFNSPREETVSESGWEGMNEESSAGEETLQDSPACFRKAGSKDSRNI